ncbi:MAG: hypothetical protein A2Y10_09035 [Planctomycetes bacterium GWF2_41_51]|nr:MAG: hypothetical protein A2Y10_09035 [Planctomycetes bacterium GWF2_41_51]
MKTLKLNKEKMLTLWNRIKLKSKNAYKLFADYCKRHKQAAISAAILIVGILITIIMVALKKQPAKVEYPELAPLVKTARIHPQDIEMVIKGYGTVKPKSQVQIVPQVSGRVVTLNPQFRTGGVIQEGEQLLQIEPKDFELAVEQAQANVAEMEVKLDIEKSEAAVARREWEQINPGTEPNSALVLREPQIKQAEAQLYSAQAVLSKAKLDLERTNIKLPINVCITEKNVDLGQYIMAGQTVGRAYGIDAVEIEVPLEDGELAWFDIPGSKAEVLSNFGGEEKILEGEVKRTTGRVDEFSRLIYVVVEVTNRDVKEGVITDILVPGKFVTVGIKGKTFKNAFAVKRDWIRNGEELWVVNGDFLNIRAVDVVRTDDKYAYVRFESGDGVEVITSSVDAVVDGMKIRVSSENK